LTFADYHAIIKEI